jgi:tripartite-type tricarboxylate transporter receptor subunit TctC
MVGYTPGGGADVLARIFAARYAEALGQPVLVENRPGAGGTVAAASLATVRPDGYTLSFAESTILAAPAIYEKVAYDPLAFAPVGQLANLPYAIVVHPSFAAKSVADLIAIAKANPGKYSYASPGVGNIAHLTAEIFSKATGVKLNHVPYKGGAPALADLVGGQVPVCFVSLPPTLPLAKSGRLRVLAVTTAKRVPIAPDVPTVAETLPGFNTATTFFLIAPPGTPAGIITVLNDSMRKVMAMPDVQEKFAEQGAIVDAGTSQALGERIRSEVATLGAAARDAGAKAE